MKYFKLEKKMRLIDSFNFNKENFSESFINYCNRCLFDGLKEYYYQLNENTKLKKYNNNNYYIEFQILPEIKKQKTEVSIEPELIELENKDVLVFVGGKINCLKRIFNDIKRLFGFNVSYNGFKHIKIPPLNELNKRKIKADISKEIKTNSLIFKFETLVFSYSNLRFTITCVYIPINDTLFIKDSRVDECYHETK